MDNLSDSPASGSVFPGVPLGPETSLTGPLQKERSEPIGPVSEITGSRFSRLLLTCGLGAAYAFLFNEGEAGLNVLIFDALLLLAFLKMEPDLRQRPLFIVAAAALLVSGISVVIVNSWLASYAHITSLLITIGVARVREIRFLWFGWLLGLFSFVRTPLDLMKHWKSGVNDQREAGAFHLRYVLVPAFIILPFLTIYYQANPAFKSAFDGLFSALEFMSGWTALLFLWGSLIAATFLFPFFGESILGKLEKQFTDHIPRRRNGRKPFLSRLQRPAMLGLRHEYELARGTLLGLNLLLLLVNLTDVFTVWFGDQERTAAELSRFVHSGTYLLMASIVLAIGVVLVFFRGLLNYYPRVRTLRKLAFLWIGQNALLALSLALRNGQYIGGYGLAWGRVQVFFLLLLIVIGLYTLYRKVDRRQSLTALLHTNGMAAWFCFIAFAAVNWGGVITRYNLANQTYEELDINYLFNGLSGNEFLLMEETFTAKYTESICLGGQYPDTSDQQQKIRQNLSYRVAPRRLNRGDWRSWNYSDARHQRAFSRFKAKINHTDENF